MSFLSTSMQDIKIAKRQIAIMKEETSFPEFYESWENFLFRIERAWEKTERNLKGRKGFQQWNQPYQSLRKNDPLLVFLRQARNAEMHSISATLVTDFGLKIKDTSGFGMTPTSISYKFLDGVLEINIKTSDLFPSVKAEFLPSSPKVSKFKNRGKWFNPPVFHLKKRLSDLHPVHLAELGLAFYSSYIQEAEFWVNGKFAQYECG